MRCLLRMDCHVPTGIQRFVAKLVALGCVVVGAAAGAAPPSVEGAKQAPSLSRYESALSDYRRFADQPVGDWREANAVVGRIGGWRAYARESQDGGAAASRGEAKPTDTPSGSAHDAHHR